jgi:hypothetical protein
MSASRYDNKTFDPSKEPIDAFLAMVLTSIKSLPNGRRIIASLQQNRVNNEAFHLFNATAQRHHQDDDLAILTNLQKFLRKEALWHTDKYALNLETNVAIADPQQDPLNSIKGPELVVLTWSSRARQPANQVQTIRQSGSC